MPRRHALTLLFLAALTTGTTLMLGGSADADVTGPCTATMNGVDVNTIDTPSTALEVPYDGTASIDVVSSAAITSHTVKLEPIGGLGFTADEGTDEGNGWSGIVDVADYAKYGVGIYKVTGTAEGPGACSGTAFVKVTGKSPLSTAAGAAGAGIAAVGAVGIVASALSARGKVRHDSGVMFSMASGSAEEPLTPEGFTNPRFCAGAALSALGLTLAYMVSGAGTPGAGVFRPIRFRPYLSISSSISSLLFGLGTIVLAQQFAVLYPTLVIVIAWLAICVALGGALLPSLIRLSGVRAVNARLGQVAATGPAQVAAAPGWEPTHRVPAEGLDAWSAPDPASAGPVRLDPRLELRVEQTSGDWAQVTASNGWTGWVDARLLESLA